MKPLITLAALIATLAGCATQPGYDTAAAAARPGEWQTVSVTNVPAGSPRNEDYTSEPVPAGSSVTYTSQGTTVYQEVPVYSPAPVYAPAPVYQAPSPAVAFSLGLIFGNAWGGVHYSPHHHYVAPRHYHTPRRHHGKPRHHRRHR